MPPAPQSLLFVLFGCLFFVNHGCSNDQTDDATNRESPFKAALESRSQPLPAAQPKSALSEAPNASEQPLVDTNTVSLVVGIDISGTVLKKKPFDPVIINKIADQLSEQGKSLHLSYAAIGDPNIQGLQTPLVFKPCLDCSKHAANKIKMANCQKQKKLQDHAAKKDNDVQYAVFRKWCDDIKTQTTSKTDLNKFIEQAGIWLGQIQAKSCRRVLFMYTDGKHDTKTGTKLVCKLPTGIEVFTSLWDAKQKCPNAQEIGQNPEMFVTAFFKQ
ncbi:MAG: hypothetical protein ACK4Q5_10450 [Saprospiraceae bacterium]